MISKRFMIGFCVAALSLFATTSVFATPDAGSTTSNAVVQNQGTDTAEIVVTYYSQDGTAALAENGELAVGAVAEFKTSDTTLSAGFVGAAIVSSDQPIAAIVSLKNDNVSASSGTKTQGAYNGTSSPAMTISFPTVWGYGNTGSIIAIQNTESSATNVTVDFYDRDGNDLGDVTLNLAAYGSETIDMGNTDDLPSGWSDSFTDGAIIATSDTTNIAGASTAHWSNRAGAYKALTSDDQGTVLYAPSHFRFQGGAGDGDFALFSALNIQNTSGSDADVTIEYFTRGDTSGTAALTLECTVPGNSAVGVNVKNGGSGCGFSASSFSDLGTNWDGSVKVTSDDSTTEFLGTVITNWGVKSYAGIYTMVTSSAAGETIYVPAQYRLGPGNQWSAINLQNIGTSQVDAADITVTYVDTDGNAVLTLTGADLPGDLAAGAAFGLNTNTGGDLASSDFDGLGTSFVGGAIITGPSGAELVTVNNIVYSNRASVYNGIAGD